MEIYTPGHNYLTDTLIMWGLMSVFRRIKSCDPAEIQIVGRGGRYQIIIKDENCINGFITELNEAIRERVDQSQYQSLVEQNAKKRKFRECLISTSLRDGLDPDTQSGVVLALQFLLEKEFNFNVFSINHIDEQNEGRLGRGETLYLPFSGIYGKYLTREYKYEEKSYRVCPLCIAFSALGFDSAVAIARRRTERIYAVFGFDGSTTLEKINALLDSIWYEDGVNTLNKAFRNNASLTTLAQAFIVFLKMPREIRRTLPQISWYMILYSYDVGRTKRITNFQILDMAPIRNAIQYIEEEYEYLPRLVDLLLDKSSIEKGGDEVLNALSEFAIARRLDGAYRVLRLLKSLIDRLDEKKPPSRRVKNELYGLLTPNIAMGLLKSLG